MQPPKQFSQLAISTEFRPGKFHHHINDADLINLPLLTHGNAPPKPLSLHGPCAGIWQATNTFLRLLSKRRVRAHR